MEVLIFHSTSFFIYPWSLSSFSTFCFLLPSSFGSSVLPHSCWLALLLAGCHKSTIKMMYGPTENGYASFAGSLFPLHPSVSLPHLGEREESTEMHYSPLSLPSSRTSCFSVYHYLFSNQLRYLCVCVCPRERERLVKKVIVIYRQYCFIWATTVVLFHLKLHKNALS